MAEGSQMSRVRRRLFAEEEGDEPREVGENRENKFLEELNKKHIETCSAKYNFDFSSETALPGNLEWYQRDANGEWVAMPVQEASPPSPTTSPPSHPSH